MNVNVKNTGVVESLVLPLSWSVSAVPSNHTVLSDARVLRSIEAAAATAVSRPAIRRVYDLVCLRILYDDAHGIQVGERKKENKCGCEREAGTWRCTKGSCISRHSERWYRQLKSRRLGLSGPSRSTKKQSRSATRDLRLEPAGTRRKCVRVDRVIGVAAIDECRASGNPFNETRNIPCIV